MSLIYTAKSADTSGKRNSLYIGGRADAKSLEKLERFNVSHILNVTPSKQTSIQAGVPNFFEKHQKFKYKRIAVYDAPTSAPQLLEASSSIVQFVASGLCHGSVLVHCQHGVSRSTACALFYLMSKADMSLEEGMALVHRRRPQAQPIPAFIEILEQYEKELIISNNKKRESANGREKEQSRQDTTKRRRVVGPSIGPSIGPAGPPPIGPQKPSVDDSVESPSKESTNTPAIGPSLLPNTTSEQNKLIGPAMPPPKEQVRNSKPETAIGPAMPPKKGLL